MFLRQIFKKKPPGYTCQHLISTLLSLRTGAFLKKKYLKPLQKYILRCVWLYIKKECVQYLQSEAYTL